MKISWGWGGALCIISLERRISCHNLLKAVEMSTHITPVFLSVKETCMKKFSYPPKLVLSREIGSKPELLRNNDRIDSNELFQTI